MDKDSWIQEKIKKLIDEGKEPDQATAIAHSMWEEQQKSHIKASHNDPPPSSPDPEPEPSPEPEPVISMVKGKESKITFARKPIVMPILPAEPQMTVDGREVTQELIDGVLTYDPTKRAAIVGLNRDEAHGTENLPILGRVERVYRKDDFIMAEVLPVQGYEEILPVLASEKYPDRSIEVDWLHLNGSDKKQLYFEAIKLCGSQRPALNLPPVSFTKQSTKEVFKYSLTGGPSMGETKEVETKEESSAQMTMVVPIEKELQNLKAEYAKRDSAKEERIAHLEAKLLDEELIHWIKSPKMMRKIPPFLRTNAVNLVRAATEGKDRTSYHFAKEIQEIPLGEALKNLMEALPDTLIATSSVADGLPNGFADVAITREERERMALAKIKKYAQDNNLSLANPLDFSKAEDAVKRENPDLWEVA